MARLHCAYQCWGLTDAGMAPPSGSFLCHRWQCLTALQRRRFLLESLAALHQSLKNLGSGLDFSISSAPDAITRLVALLARECSSITLCYHLDYGLSHQEEAAAAERAFLQAAKAAGRLSVDHLPDD